VGMNRDSDCCTFFKFRVPHMRGDEPV